MDLIMTFENEAIPFVMQNVPEEDCLKAVNAARNMGFDFNKDSPSTKITDSLIRLHAFKKQRPKKRRLYIHGDDVLLETDAGCPDEKEPTKALLAYEKGLDPSGIHVIELEK